MDGSQLIECFDSLWLFSNVLSSSSSSGAQHLGPSSDENENEIENASENHAKESINEGPSKLRSPVLQNLQQNETQNVSQRCPTCGEFAAEIEPIIVQPFVSEVVEFAGTPEQEEKRRRRRKRSKGSKLHQRRKVLGELDVGFERSMVSDQSWETCGYQRFGVQRNMKMPPLSDGMAMKEHLKSWAYAVACTVK